MSLLKQIKKSYLKLCLGRQQTDKARQRIIYQIVNLYK